MMTDTRTPGSTRTFSSTSADGPSVGLNLRSLTSLIRRRWPLFLLVAVPVFVSVVIVTMKITPIYSSAAQIQIDLALRSPLDAPASVADGQPDQAQFDTEVALIKSREAAKAVVGRFRLDRDPEFAGKSASSPAMAQEQAVNSALNHLLVSRRGTTYVVDLAFSSHDPGKSAALANAFAEQYIANSIAARTTTASRQSETLDKRLGELGSEVRQADQQLAQYRASNGLVQGDAAGTITEQQIAPLSSQLATAESEAAAARANLAAAQAQLANGGIDAVSGVLSSNVVADLRGKRAEILREQGQIGARYGPLHPDYIRVANQLRDIDRQIAEESRRIVRGLEASAQAANARAGSLRGELGKLKGEQARNTRASATADGLQRQAEAKSVVYTQTAQAAQRISQQERNTEAQARIVEPAVVPPQPSFPNRPLFILLGGLVAFLLGMSAITIVEMANRAVRTVEDVEQRLKLAFVASIPQVSKRLLKRHGKNAGVADYAVERPMSGYAEAIRTLRQSIQTPASAPRVVAICSALTGEGKTSTALALARIMALSGDRVALIDCDLRRHALSDLAPPSEAGLVQVLDGSAQLDQALVADSVEGLWILPLAETSFSPKDLFSGQAMTVLLGQMRSRFDFVLLDTPPILAVADACTLAERADASLVLIGWDRTPLAAVRAALARLTQCDATILGGALSNVSRRAAQLSEADPAYYSQAYSSYYQN